MVKRSGSLATKKKKKSSRPTVDTLLPDDTMTLTESKSMLSALDARLEAIERRTRCRRKPARRSNQPMSLRPTSVPTKNVTFSPLPRQPWSGRSFRPYHVCQRAVNPPKSPPPHYRRALLRKLSGDAFNRANSKTGKSCSAENVNESNLKCRSGHVGDVYKSSKQSCAHEGSSYTYSPKDQKKSNRCSCQCSCSNSASYKCSNSCCNSSPSPYPVTCLGSAPSMQFGGSTHSSNPYGFGNSSSSNASAYARLYNSGALPISNSSYNANGRFRKTTDSWMRDQKLDELLLKYSEYNFPRSHPLRPPPSLPQPQQGSLLDTDFKSMANVSQNKSMQSVSPWMTTTHYSPCYPRLNNMTTATKLLLKYGSALGADNSFGAESRCGADAKAGQSRYKSEAMRLLTSNEPAFHIERFLPVRNTSPTVSWDDHRSLKSTPRFMTSGDYVCGGKSHSGDDVKGLSKLCDCWAHCSLRDSNNINSNRSLSCDASSNLEPWVNFKVMEVYRKALRNQREQEMRLLQKYVYNNRSENGANLENLPVKSELFQEDNKLFSRYDSRNNSNIPTRSKLEAESEDEHGLRFENRYRFRREAKSENRYDFSSADRSTPRRNWKLNRKRGSFTDISQTLSNERLSGQYGGRPNFDRASLLDKFDDYLKCRDNKFQLNNKNENRKFGKSDSSGIKSDMWKGWKSLSLDRDDGRIGPDVLDNFSGRGATMRKRTMSPSADKTNRLNSEGDAARSSGTGPTKDQAADAEDKTLGSSHLDTGLETDYSKYLRKDFCSIDLSPPKNLTTSLLGPEPTGYDLYQEYMKKEPSYRRTAPEKSTNEFTPKAPSDRFCSSQDDDHNRKFSWSVLPSSPPIANSQGVLKSDTVMPAGQGETNRPEWTRVRDIDACMNGETQRLINISKIIFKSTRKFPDSYYTMPKIQGKITQTDSSRSGSMTPNASMDISP